MVNKDKKNYLSNAFQELGIVKEMTDAAMSASTKDMNTQVHDINRQTQDVEHSRDTENLMRSDIDYMNKKLLNEVYQVVPQILSAAKNNTYMYIAIGAVCILLLAVFIKSNI
jgi:predicted S18 family serine protease